jgi:hypothetical protein
MQFIFIRLFYFFYIFIYYLFTLFYYIYIFFIINVGVRAILRVHQLILWILKLTII